MQIVSFLFWMGTYFCEMCLQGVENVKRFFVLHFPFPPYHLPCLNWFLLRRNFELICNFANDTTWNAICIFNLVRNLEIEIKGPPSMVRPKTIEPLFTFWILTSPYPTNCRNYDKNHFSSLLPVVCDCKKKNLQAGTQQEKTVVYPKCDAKKKSFLFFGTILGC